MSNTDFRTTTDASKWAKAFEEHKKRNKWKLEDIDEGLMIGWFANAIMKGYDEGRRAGEALVVDTEANHGSS